ncbi:MAG: hypothetical protein ABIE43_01120 [Patescibacteria group bacterium]
MSQEVKKLAKLLRTSEKILLDVVKKMDKISGKKGIVEKIIQENYAKVKDELSRLGQ